MTVWRQTGHSSNLTFWRGHGDLWCEVLESRLVKRDGHWRAQKIATFNVTLYRAGYGRVSACEFRAYTLTAQKLATAIRLAEKPQHD